MIYIYIGHEAPPGGGEISVLHSHRGQQSNLVNIQIHTEGIQERTLCNLDYYSYLLKSSGILSKNL